MHKAQEEIGNNKMCVVIVPVHKHKLNRYELLSVTRSKEILERFDKIIVIPDDFSIEELNRHNKNIFEGFLVRKFEKIYFKSRKNNTVLFCAEQFYKAFSDYKYMLIVQIDALVISNQLVYWCEKGYDYIGAPWLNKMNDYLDMPLNGKVGNGGFSLRKIKSCLRVIEIYKEYNNTFKLNDLRLFPSLTANYFPEDVFWGLIAQRWYEQFKVAPFKEALAFAFEEMPYWCYKQNNYKLPFGCHRWSLWPGSVFWITHLKFLYYLIPKFLFMSFIKHPKWYIKKFIPINYKNFSADGKRLISNFFALLSQEATNYIFPLITLPYLVRVLGPEKYGLIAFAQAFVQYFIIFMNYGFNLSATRNISLYRDNREKISQIFSSIVLIKLIFMLLCLSILINLIIFIPRFKLDLWVYLFAFGLVVSNVFSLGWFFQGMERMKFIAFLNLFMKIIFMVAIFTFVRFQADYIYVPLITSLTYIASGILSLWLAWRYFGIKFCLPSLTDVRQELKEGWHVFISTLAMNLYACSNTFVLGLFTNNTMVGYYSGAEKLMKASRKPLSPFSSSLYPYISKLISESREKALNLIRKIVIFIGVAAFFISLLIFVFAGFIVNLVLGAQYQESILVLRILAFLPFIIALSNIFGIQTMLTLNLKTAFSRIVILAAFINLSLAFLLVPIYKHIGISIAVLATEIFVTLSMYFYLRYKGIRILQV